MSDTAIRVDKISKRYRIGIQGEIHDTLVGAVVDFLRRPLRNWRRLARLNSFGEDGCEQGDTIWGLRDVSFEVERGEVLGIIGRNGAGKTTLLKILALITHPTSGRAVIDGRVGSLLEVGTGFHPELTGRENVYLNGTILGMTKAEVDRKFDEIVLFSGLERFLDTPVKRYSSGMRVRLAFAVAAHLEPEILLVDEVLAVGDLAFQKKCLGKMGEVASAGRTVLFVSHNMQMINELCPRAILLDQGGVVSDGPAGEVLSQYYDLLARAKIGPDTAIDGQQARGGTGWVRFTSIVVEDGDGNERSRFRSGETVRFRLAYRVYEPVENLYVTVFLRSGKTREVLGSTGRHCVSPGSLREGRGSTFWIEISTAQFGPGIYPLYFWLGTDNARRAARFADRLPCDVVDDLTPPLVVYSEDEQRTRGIVDVESRVILEDEGAEMRQCSGVA